MERWGLLSSSISVDKFDNHHTKVQNNNEQSERPNDCKLNKWKNSCLIPYSSVLQMFLQCSESFRMSS